MFKNLIIFLILFLILGALIWYYLPLCINFFKRNEDEEKNVKEKNVKEKKVKEKKVKEKKVKFKSTPQFIYYEPDKPSITLRK